MAARDLLAERARQVAAQPARTCRRPASRCAAWTRSRELCVGCLRTLDEIALWGRMEDEAKREVWRLIEDSATWPLPRQTARAERKRVDMKQITFYLDFISPYAYLAFEKLPEALQG